MIGTRVVLKSTGASRRCLLNIVHRRSCVACDDARSWIPWCEDIETLIASQTELHIDVSSSTINPVKDWQVVHWLEEATEVVDDAIGHDCACDVPSVISSGTGHRF